MNRFKTISGLCAKLDVQKLNFSAVAANLLSVLPGTKISGGSQSYEIKKVFNDIAHHISNELIIENIRDCHSCLWDSTTFKFNEILTVNEANNKHCQCANPATSYQLPRFFKTCFEVTKLTISEFAVYFFDTPCIASIPFFGEVFFY